MSSSYGAMNIRGGTMNIVNGTMDNFDGTMDNFDGTMNKVGGTIYNAYNTMCRNLEQCWWNHEDHLVSNEYMSQGGRIPINAY